jgi:hypothetical protein
MLVVLLKNRHVIHQSYIACYMLSKQLIICHLDNTDRRLIKVFMIYLTALSISLEYIAQNVGNDE